jgi:hypothetical protein
LLLFFQEAAGLRLVRYRPTEVNFYLDNLLLAQGDDFRIAKDLAVRPVTFVGHKHAVTVNDKINKFEIRDLRAVRPATREISLAVNPVINRTRKVEVRRKQSLNGRSLVT